MVCFSSLAHFATDGVTAELLYPIIWKGIRLVESMGLKVIAVTADGANLNRKFLKMHGDGDIYKTKNIYTSDDRYMYFIYDPPHLIKTTRNCLSHSHINN